MTPQKRVDQFIKDIHMNINLFFMKLLDLSGITMFYRNYVKDRVKITSEKCFEDPLRVVLPILYFIMGCYLTYEYAIYVYQEEGLFWWFTNIFFHAGAIQSILSLFVSAFLILLTFLLPFLLTYLISISVEIIITLYLKEKISMTITLMMMLIVVLLI